MSPHFSNKAGYRLVCIHPPHCYLWGKPKDSRSADVPISVLSAAGTVSGSASHQLCDLEKLLVSQFPHLRWLLDEETLLFHTAVLSLCISTDGGPRTVPGARKVFG